ncbi:MAG: hypothetical protein ACKVIX_08095 [Sphingomonadales bacterium]
MKILNSIDELEVLLSPIAIEAYLGPDWLETEPENMVIDSVTMDFKNPSFGTLITKVGHKVNEKVFFIKITTEFGTNNNEEKFTRALTLIGNAETGVILAILPEGSNNPLEISEINWTNIQKNLKALGAKKVCQLQKDGFIAFSSGNITIPNVVYLPFKEQNGDLHLKGAHKKGGDIFVLKIATGFPKNKDRGIATSQGIMIAFDAHKGDPLTILTDEGHLTDLRTAISGRNAAEELMSPDDLIGIGVLGTGTQARLQIMQLETLYPNCRKLTVWGRTVENIENYRGEMKNRGWDVTIANNPKNVADISNLIITTTSSKSALLEASDIIYPNTVIIAIGADTPGKIELAPDLLKKAHNILIDSIIQGKDHGNAAFAIKEGIINEEDIQEFGDYLSNGLKNQNKKKELRIFLSSGIGVQDLQIVEAVTLGAKLEYKSSHTLKGSF